LGEQPRLKQGDKTTEEVVAISRLNPEAGMNFNKLKH
jgi:hypothetical protein